MTPSEVFLPGAFLLRYSCRATLIIDDYTVSCHDTAECAGFAGCWQEDAQKRSERISGFAWNEADLIYSSHWAR